MADRRQGWGTGPQRHIPGRSRFGKGFLAIPFFYLPWGKVHRQLVHLSPHTLQIRVFIVFWSCLDIFSIVTNSLYGALVNDVIPQAAMGPFSDRFAALGLRQVSCSITGCSGRPTRTGNDAGNVRSALRRLFRRHVCVCA
ncbi:MAG: hypothetical protein JWM57_1133 [Phycisphaerales bacterium]|nr:hypothetical protein [Phycisphaerales bacterium]